MRGKSTDSALKRDILEWNVPEEVLAVLLKDRSTGRNLIWATDDYAARGKGFGANDEMQVAQIVDKDHPVIRPRVDKNAEEQRQRSVKRAEVFTPSWICNKQNNLVDAAWFGWKKRDSSPFNTELPMGGPPSSATADATDMFLPWKTSLQRVKFPKGKTWQEYVKAPRLEVSCGEAPYLVSRYDTVSGRIIPDLDGTVETHIEECPGCSKKGNHQHFGAYCKVMDWNRGEPVEFRAIAENGGGHGK